MSFGALCILATLLAADVLPLKPPLSDEGRRHPGPTVIRAGALKETDEVTAHARRQQFDELKKRQEEEIELARRKAAQLVTRLENMTAADLEQGRDVLGKMRQAGMPEKRIEAMRHELEDAARKLREEGGRLRVELKRRGLEVPEK